MADPADRGIHSAQLGILVNTLLAVTKLVAGVSGNAYALVADAVESGADIFSSLIVLGGLRIARREPDDRFPFGYGRAETLATVVVSVMLLGTAAGIAIEAVREIRTPHHLPAPWTLAVLATVIVVKWFVSRHVKLVGTDIGSTAVQADAWHHFSDAVTSAAAFIGISIALWGGPGWEPADDWAALVASAVIVYNAIVLMIPALRDLMDAAPDEKIVNSVRNAAQAVPRVLAVEKVHVRRSGMIYHVDIHVQAAPSLPLVESRSLGGQVKSAIREAVPQVSGVLVHMEPFESEGQAK
ncbi:MAG: cation transporter [Planctomycetaceae bacterium]|nr:cation transporter [Planctomycetaceae bacterium]